MFKHFPFIHNHGDFVHLDALRDWLRGVVSLETFLKSKNDKAIIKDMHFTDERTTVDYIDTKDDTEKTETLCEYLTSDVFDETNSTQFNKVDKITVRKDSHGENWLDMREKATQKQRLGLIRSNVPIAYDATDDYSTSLSRTSHLGFTNRSIKLYSDDKLNIIKRYEFCNPIAYDVTDDYKNAPKAYYVGVNENGITIFNNDTQEILQEYNFTSGGGSTSVSETSLSDCNPFGGCLNVADNSPINIVKRGEFFATKINGAVVSGQVVYVFSDKVSVSAGKSVTLQFSPATMGVSNFSQNVYLKNARCFADNAVQSAGHSAGLISSLHFYSQGSFPTDNNIPVRLTVFNPNDTDIILDAVLFTF